MSEKFTNPISLLHKYLVVEFEGSRDVIYINEYNKENNCIMGMMHPGTKRQTYAELYMDDQPDYWYVLETF